MYVINSPVKQVTALELNWSIVFFKETSKKTDHGKEWVLVREVG
jgi:hypothetical protein